MPAGRSGRSRAGGDWVPSREQIGVRAPSWPRSAGQLFGAQESGIDGHRNENSRHQDEREGGSSRIVVLTDEPALDDIADHLALWIAEQLSVYEVADRRNEHEDRAGKDSGQRQREGDPSKGLPPAGVKIVCRLDQPRINLLEGHVE